MPEEDQWPERRMCEVAPISQSQQRRLQETDGCRTRTAVQEQHVQMFADQNDGMLHGVVAN